jgi:hypothetical protein
MRWVRLWLFALLWPCALAAQTRPDDHLLRQALEQLASHPQVRAQFVQQRDNPALARAQESRGQLLFVLGHGMLWQTREPYQESLALSAGRIARIDAQGQLQTLRGGSQGINQVAQMLQALLAGDSDLALRQFAVQASGEPSRWTLRFTPIQARTAKVLASITLQGGSYLDGIDVQMASGEQTRIRFSDSRVAGTLSDLERHALGLP